jgi:hypothetical protein
MVDPLSTEAAPYLLMASWDQHVLYRMSVNDGTVTHVLGVLKSVSGKGDGGLAVAQFNSPNGLALAPRELLHDNDALALVLCDLGNGRLRIVRVPY